MCKWGENPAVKRDERRLWIKNGTLIDGSGRDPVANALIVANNFPEAQQETGLLLQKWPNDPQSHITASSLFAAQGKFPKAIDEMQKAIELAAAERANTAAFQNNFALASALGEVLGFFGNPSLNAINASSNRSAAPAGPFHREGRLPCGAM